MDTNYRAVLQVAMAAAREAGAVLLADLLKPGGPDGFGTHADADDRAEALIRARLLTATPDWGYLGEETGRATPPAPTAHIWLVDPNDGTSAYLRGWRGSAVSIGLLREGVPVLGVVFAFAAPDNAGDLVAWAEGCGPILRNGVPIRRPPWPPGLRRETVILLSQGADRAAAANLAAILPARYRAMPSIAYRLALVAVGEAAATVSLQGPGAWDYAAGHALLRAVGGDLVNETGTPVTYTADGVSRTGRCFGGAPDLLKPLAERSWPDVLKAARLAREATGLCWPDPGLALADSRLLGRAQGCLLGQIAGDALGSMVEFQSSAALQQHYPAGLREIGPSPVWGTLAGQPTDDSELALALARTLARTGPGFDTQAVATAYGAWLASGPFDVGSTIGKATAAILQAQATDRDIVAAAHHYANPASEANGALMRQSPLAIWGHALDPNILDDHIIADTRLTHPSPVCRDASAAYVVALAATIHEGLDGEAAYARAWAWNNRLGTSPLVTGALAAARHDPPNYERHQGHVLIALQNAFYQALHAPTFEEGVVATVMGGGDTDTNAAIAGALLGAIHGARAIPPGWRQTVLTCRPHAATGAAHPRPPTYWPVDALLLAERLLLAGPRPNL